MFVKMRRLKSKLKQWNKEKKTDFEDNIAKLEERLREMEGIGEKKKADGFRGSGNKKN